MDLYGYPVRRYRATRFPPSRAKISLVVPPSAMAEQRYRRLPMHRERFRLTGLDNWPPRGGR